MAGLRDDREGRDPGSGSFPPGKDIGERVRGTRKRIDTDRQREQSLQERILIRMRAGELVPIGEPD